MVSELGGTFVGTVGGVAVTVFSSDGTAVGTGTSAPPSPVSPVIGELGEGMSVGTGISVGEDAPGRSDTEGVLVGAASCLLGRLPSSGAGDVGDGTSVGTGISVGEA